jgi:hypothetical protein
MSSLQVDNLQTYNSNPPVIKNVSGTEVGTFCRAWVNFNGTGTVAIRASFNVSSITDNGATDYTVNFTTAMADANYAVAATAGGTPNGAFNRTAEDLAARTTSAIRFYTNVDAPQVNVAIFR